MTVGRATISTASVSLFTAAGRSSISPKRSPSHVEVQVSYRAETALVQTFLFLTASGILRERVTAVFGGPPFACHIAVLREGSAQFLHS